MIRLLLIILIVACKPPNNETFFTFDKVAINKIPSIESRHNSKTKNIDTPIFIANDYLPGNYNISPFPLIFSRKDESFSPVTETEVVYYFSEPDSVLRLITYTWDTKKIGDSFQDIDSANDADIDSFLEKFEKIKSEISSSLGHPIENSSDLNSIEDENFGRWKEKTAKWQKDNTVVDLKLIFTEGKKRLGTHSIRTKIYWID
jgi:hypothetical protein